MYFETSRYLGAQDIKAAGTPVRERGVSRGNAAGAGLTNGSLLECAEVMLSPHHFLPRLPLPSPPFWHVLMSPCKLTVPISGAPRFTGIPQSG